MGVSGAIVAAIAGLIWRGEYPLSKRTSPQGFRAAASSGRQTPKSSACQGPPALFLGVAIFALLWILGASQRAIYVPNGLDVPALADGLLLAPDAHWANWFTRGYSDFWDLYPDWGGHSSNTAFTRPGFQLVIYLAHFAFGRDWASYAAISCVATAGVAAVAFQISQTALKLATGPSLLAACLAVLSPPVLGSWLNGLAFAIEPLATIFIGCAFLAAISRRDTLCLVLLILALLTKENAVWACIAAAITILLRPKSDDDLFRHRVLASTSMLLPIAMWLGFRWAFFGGVGGTYATTGYTPFAYFLGTIFVKLTHLQDLFFFHPHRSSVPGGLPQLERSAAVGTALLTYGLLFLSLLRLAPEIVKGLHHCIRERRWPSADASSLVALWAAIALAFYLAVPLGAVRYAAPVVIFAWPLFVAEVERLRRPLIWLIFAACSVIALVESANGVASAMSWSAAEHLRYRSMNVVLRQAPAATRQIFVIPTTESSLQSANPRHLALVLGVTPEIVRLVEIDWRCPQTKERLTVEHSTINGLVILTLTLPSCATFSISAPQLEGTSLATVHLDRGAAISYDLDNKPQIKRSKWFGRTFLLGHKITIRVHPKGPARFIVEQEGQNNIFWFDTP